MRTPFIFTALVLVIAGTLAVGATPGADAEPGAIGVSPARVSFDSPGAFAGETVSARMTLHNTRDQPAVFRIDASGSTAAAWLRVPDGFAVQVSADASRVITVSFAVPADAAPGDHAALLTFLVRSDSGDDTGRVAVDQALHVPVRVHVAGIAVRDFAIANATLVTGRSDARPEFLFTHANTGNVRGAGAGTVVVTDVDGRPVLEATRALNALDAGQIAVQPWTLPTPLAVGDYHARFRITPGTGDPVVVAFRILPPGVLPDSAEAGKVGLSGDLAVVSTAADPGLVIRTTFRNPGAAPITGAKLVANVFRNDQWIGAFTSDAQRVDPAGLVDLDITVAEGADDGTYQVHAYVAYDGYRTAEWQGGMVRVAARGAVEHPVTTTVGIALGAAVSIGTAAIATAVTRTVRSGARKP